MGSAPPLVTFLLMAVSGWVHRRQLIVIEFLQAENRLLKHQGLNNTLIRADLVNAANDAFIHRRQRLGGMLNYYYRAAA